MGADYTPNSITSYLRVTGKSLKGVHERTQQSITSTATFTHNSDSYDSGKLTAQAVDFTMAAPTGTPTEGMSFTMWVKPNTTGVEITWDAAFRTMGVTLPTAALTNAKWHVMIFIYNSTDSKWDLMSYVVQP